MQAVLYNIWNEAKKLPRFEKIELMERLVHSLKWEDQMKENISSWEDMYGIGKGVWGTDAQEYVDRIREERF